MTAPMASTGTELFARIDNETLEQQLLQSGVLMTTASNDCFSDTLFPFVFQNY